MGLSYTMQVKGIVKKCPHAALDLNTLRCVNISNGAAKD